MGLLAPLYALAALAIVGPIIFHLIKRQPQGQQPFSSLMFLSPSPPRLTRRSRLDNILLLILRALAIGLIAFAFARPFFRQESFLNQNLEGRNIALLIDTSASMQRTDVWSAAKAQADKLLDSLSPADRVALYAVSDQLLTLVPLDTENVADPASQQQAVRAAVAEMKPGWRGSQVANGLKSVADQLQAAAIAGKLGGDASAELVLISDLHVNCGVEALQGYPWPESIRLDVRQVRAALPGNARASLMATDADGSDEEDKSAMKLRVENNSDSLTQALELKWVAGATAVPGAATTLQVPPGQVRVIPAPAQPANANRLELTGDSWSGDNTLYVAEPVRTRERILCVGVSTSRKEDDLAYFIEKAPLSTAVVNRAIERLPLSELGTTLSAAASPAAVEVLRAVIVEPPLSATDAQALRTFAGDGGCVIVCLAKPLADNTAVQTSLQALFGTPQMQVTEARTKDFALLSDIDFLHPVFSPFADPRFNDFSKIRFWSHRRVALGSLKAAEDSTIAANESPSIRRVASLDDGSPWLLHQPLGAGNLWLMTSGWQPTASQLGLSSKFVPILLGILDPTGKSLSAQLVYAVGDVIPVSDPSTVQVSDAAGLIVEVESTSDGLQIEAPGLYTVREGQASKQIAVQVPTSESQLTPLDVDVFEQFGIELGKVKSNAERIQSARQLQVTELERQQRIWQWLLLAGLGVLAIETILAGWLTRRTAGIPSAQPQTVG